jgi:dihydrofolate reductase
MRMIVAADRANAIGWADGRLPWKLALDMRRFKTLTTGGVVIMGFNTFMSLGRPNGLPNRTNIVLTRKNPRELFGKLGDDIQVFSSMEYLSERVPQDAWIIGGATVYAEAIDLGLIDEIRLTQVHANSGADVALRHDLFSWKRFMLERERANEGWMLDELEHLLDAETYLTFLTLKRWK